MLRRPAGGGGDVEDSRQAMDAEVSAPDAADRRGPVILPPSSSRWYEASTTYRYIVEQGKKIGEVQGRTEVLRRVLLRWGQKRFGTPPVTVAQVLESLSDIDRMERMVDRMVDRVPEVSSWQELLDTP
jgi:hypothetical protein